MRLKEELSKRIQGEVHDDAAALDHDSRDASIFEIRPSVIVAPKDVADVGAIVSYVASHHDKSLSITPRAAGTDMTGGAIGESIVMEMTPHLNAIKEVGDDYAVVAPGVFYRDFEKATLAHTLLLPSYPASRELCTVGGMVANNSGGEKSLRYGKTERFVAGLKVVLRDGKEYTLAPLSRLQLDLKMAQDDFEGEIYRRVYEIVEKNYDLVQRAKPNVTKNSAGYNVWSVWDRETFDLSKLFVGSQGTLGVITEIRFRLVKPEPHSKLLVMFLRDFSLLAGLARAIGECKPESFESYDDNTLKITLRYLGDLTKQMGGKNIFQLAWRFLPEAWMAVTGGIPKLVLLAEFTGASEAEVDAKLAQAKSAVAPFNIRSRITKTEEEAKKYWTIRRESFNVLRKRIKKLRTAPFIDDFCVRPSDLPKFLPELYEILDQYDLLFTIAGHVGDGNFHIIPLMDLANVKTKQIIEELAKKVYALVFKYGGSMTGEHNDGLIRGPYLEQMFGAEVFAVFKEIKKIFDPDGIFNPGKKVDASLPYAMAHIKKS